MGKFGSWLSASIFFGLGLLVIPACQQMDECSSAGLVSPEGAQTKPTPQARTIAESLPTVIIQRAQKQVMQERQAECDKRRETRQKAEADYNAARERREKVAPLARPKLNLDPEFLNLLPALRHESLIAEIYGIDSGNPRHFFVQDNHLTPAADVLIKVLKNVDDHALNPEDFAADTLEQLGIRLDKMHEFTANTERLNLNDNELIALTRALENELIVGDSTLSAQAFKTLSKQEQIDSALLALCAPENSPVPRIAALCQKEIEHRREMELLSETLEYTLADAWMGYAETMGYGNTEKFSDEEREKYTNQDNPEVHPKYYDRIIEARLKTITETLLNNPDPSVIAKRLDDLVPAHEQYAKLQKLRERYQNYVKDGGWAVIPPDRMFAGGHAPLVKNLKNRLAIEGYYTGEIDDFFDPSLTKAIKKYQKHHQLEETGEVGEVFWRSLNVSADQRLAEIEVNIRRWHKTMYEPRDKYIYINIPAFEVELWSGGKRISVHKTVVGSSTRICNTRTQEWELMNSTKLMHAHMTYLVFNPYWNVPPRIEVDEFYKKMAEDPKWLEKSDFEYFTPRGGGRVLRQKPGPENALGKVKLIFPNRHNTYLHDTPKKDMFKYPIRAFSHGCIRVEGAYTFAREILTLDGQWDEKKIQRFFRDNGEHPVDLTTPIDVFIEYHTVTVDDEGDPYFLADVYKIIRDEINPPTALQRRCNPATDRTSQFRSGAGEDTGP